MNRRAFRLVLFSLVITTLGALVAPGVAIADPIGDKQAEAAQLEAQINSNAEKLSGLNERINSAQNELDQAESDIRAADALVEAAKEKTRELRAEVARRAAVVYAQSGSTGGVEELDAQNAQDLSSRQKYSSLAAQRDKEIVHSLAKAKEQVTERKADAEAARQVAQQQQDEIKAQKAKLDEGQAALEQLQSKVTGEIQVLVQQAEQERQAREAAAAAQQYSLQQSAAGRHRWWRRWRWRRRRRVECHTASDERRRVRGPRLRVRAAGQALLLRGCRPRLLRLLGPHDDGVGAGRRVDVARLLRPDGVVPEGLDGPAAAR